MYKIRAAPPPGGAVLRRNSKGAGRLTLWKTKFILDATDYSRNFAQCFRLEEQRAVCERAQAREERRAVERVATTERALT